jgi:multiple sugar transport system ATP-binding protein
VASVTFTNVAKIYPDGKRAVSDLNLTVRDGEFMVLVGPSGCGKTTALRMVAGIEDISTGVIEINGQVVNHVEPRRRDVAMVFQNYALYPHMTVFQNVAFPLRAQRLPRSEIAARVTDAARRLGLEDELERKPKQLSGGQRQRVALGRALVREPKVFLMDEPLSNLDASLRSQMRAEIAGLQRQLGITTLYVTHDQVEAMTMGHRVAVMWNGRLQQEGPPQEVYDNPGNLFVASFIGSPTMNIARARLEGGLGGVDCVAMGCRIPVSNEVLRRSKGLARYVGHTVALGVRPEHLTLDGGGSSELTFRGVVRLVETLGAERLVHVEIAGEPVVSGGVLEAARAADVVVATERKAQAQQHKLHFVARVNNDYRVREGEGVGLRVAPEKMRFFAEDSGDAV